jgi:hypothetical protein
MDITQTIADLEKTIILQEGIIERAKATIAAAKSKKKRLTTVLNNAKDILSEDQQPETGKPTPPKSQIITEGEDPR